MSSFATRRVSDLAPRLLALLCVCVLAAWVGNRLLGAVLSPGVAANTRPLRLGAILSLSGPTSFMGDPARKTLEAMARDLNARGGLRGRPLQIVVHDSQGEVGLAVEAARTLAADPDILAVIGPSLPAEAVAIIPVLEERRIPLISIAAGGTPAQPVHSWAFQITHSDAHAVGCILDYLSGRQVRELAFLGSDDAFGSSGQAQVKEQGSGRGFSIVLEERYPSGDVDPARIRSFLERTRSSRAAALIVWAPHPGPSLVTRLARDLKLPQTLVLCPAVATRDFLRQTGAAADGVLFPASPLLLADALPDTHPQRGVLLEYRRWFESTWHQDATPCGGQAWDALRLLTEALLAVEPQRAKLRAWLEETRDYVGTTGVFRFSSADHDGLGSDSLIMARIDRSRWGVAP